MDGPALCWVGRYIFQPKAAVAVLGLFFFPAGGLPAEEPGLVTLRVMVYNLKNYSVLEEEGFPTPKPEALRQQQADLIAGQKPNLVGLMEVGGRAALTDLQKRLERAGWDLPYAILVEAEDVHRQLALLADRPLRDLSRTDLRFVKGSSFEGPARGLLWAAFEAASGKEWQVAGLHWKSRRETPGGDSAALRLGEARVMRQAFDEAFAAQPDLPLMVWGDFNEARTEPAHQALQGPSQSPGALQVVDLVDAQGDRWTHYWKETDQYARLDFLLISRALRPFRREDDSGILRPDNWLALSDHRPLLVVFELPR
jgi:endonuclease/exonuclease/phosphatase family metal-dependent hydrolase